MSLLSGLRVLRWHSTLLVAAHPSGVTNHACTSAWYSDRVVQSWLFPGDIGDSLHSHNGGFATSMSLWTRLMMEPWFHRRQLHFCCYFVDAKSSHAVRFHLQPVFSRHVSVSHIYVNFCPPAEDILEFEIALLFLVGQTCQSFRFNIKKKRLLLVDCLTASLRKGQ